MLKRCWEIKKCGREKGGVNVKDKGVCPAYPDHGHSCWFVVGTLCGGKVQENFAQKREYCIVCEVYKRYRGVLLKEYPDEEYEWCQRIFKDLTSSST